MDSYGEEFINVNNDRIIKRIKTLMKENFFYRKEDLITSINVVNEYPTSQINSALNQLIEDKNEYITDKYNRLGNLINIGDLYLFQPLEINNNKISAFERSTPLDFKRSKLRFDVKKSQKDNVLSIDKNSIQTYNITNNLMREMKNNFDLAMNSKDVKRGNNNWYSLSSVVINDLKNNNIAQTLIESALVGHIIEELNLESMRNILNYFQTKNDTMEQLDDFENIVNAYFNNIIITKDNIKYILLNDKQKQKLLKQVDKDWIDGEPEDYGKIKLELTEQIKNLKYKNFNKTIGFMSYFKNNNVVFKIIKDTSKKRDSGARCDQAQKPQSISILNEIMDYQYNKKLNQKQLCIYQELIMRIYNINKKNNKIWFLRPVEYIIMNINN